MTASERMKTPDTRGFSHISWVLLRALAVITPLVVGVVPWGPRMLYDVFHTLPHLALGAIASIALVFWTIGALRREADVRHDPMQGAIAGFLLLALIATATATYLPTALVGDSQDSGSLLAWFIMGSAAFLAFQHTTGSDRMRSLARSLVAGAAVLATITLIQRLTGIDPLGMIDHTDSAMQWMNARGTGTLGNPDFVGNYLAGVAPLSLALTLAPPKGDRGLANVLGWLAFAVITIGAIGSLARGAWIALMIGTVLVLWSIRSRREALRSTALIVGVTFLIGIALVFVISQPNEPLSSRFAGLEAPATADTSRLEKADALLSGRLGTWSEAIDIAVRHPLLGVGPANYRLGWYASQGVSGLPVHGASMTGDPHSLPLLTAATLGIPAALLLIGILAFSLVRATQTVSGGSDERRVVYAGWTATLVALSIASLLASTTLAFLTLIGITLGVVWAPHASPRAGTWTVLPPVIVTAIVTLVLAVMLVPAVGAQRTALAALTTSRIDLLEEAAHEAADSPSIRVLWVRSLNRATLTAVMAGQAGQPQIAAALTEADEAIEAMPADYELYREKALLMFGLEQVVGDEYADPAIEAAEQAIAVSPIAIDIRTQLAAILLERGEPDRAVETLAPVWDRDRQDALAGATYVDALTTANRLDDARAALEVLTERFPDSADVAAASERLAAKLESR